MVLHRGEQKGDRPTGQKGEPLEVSKWFFEKKEKVNNRDLEIELENPKLYNQTLGFCCCYC